MSKRRGKKRLPNYVEETIEALHGKVHPGQVYAIKVRHDSWCDLLKGKWACNCNPEISAPERVPSPEEN